MLRATVGVHTDTALTHVWLRVGYSSISLLTKKWPLKNSSTKQYNLLHPNHPLLDWVCLVPIVLVQPYWHCIHVSRGMDRTQNQWWLTKSSRWQRCLTRIQLMLQCETRGVISQQDKLWIGFNSNSIAQHCAGGATSLQLEKLKLYIIFWFYWLK